MRADSKPGHNPLAVEMKIMKKLLLLISVLILAQCKYPYQGEKNDFAFMIPGHWSQLDMKQVEIPFGHGSRNSVKYDSGIVVDAVSTVASMAGIQALRNGGNAMDAALTTALTSIALQGGAAVSYAGFINVMYYDSRSGNVHAMNGGFNTVKDEKDPLTIDYDNPGRTVLVPGFIKGVESAHQKFGSMPFQALFIPAIYFAEEGIPFPVHLSSILEESKDHLTSGNTRSLFQNSSGEWIKQGDLFKQPELAKTLRKVAAEGARYMYSGEWAENFVRLVRSQGGKITMEDLDNYNVIWASPLTTEYIGYQVNAMPLPNTGGVNTIEALNILSHLHFKADPPYYESAESLFKLTRTSNVAHLMGTGINYIATDSILEQMPFPNIDFNSSSRSSQENAKAIANVILSKEWEESMMQNVKDNSTHGGHSDAVIAVDENGNVATILFTINTYGWGRNGLFVDGVSIPDAAVYQKHHLAELNPGERVPEATTPIIVLKNGKPFLISNAIANGVHEATLKNLVSVLNYGFNPLKAVLTPDFGAPKYMIDLENIEINTEEGRRTVFGNTVREGIFLKNLLDSLKQLGQPIDEIDQNRYGNYSGLWIGVKINPVDNTLEGTTPNSVLGGVNGY